MEIHRITVTVVDFDRIGADACANAILNARYPNRCISPDLQSIETRDIGDWHDGHPLNRTDTAAQEIERLFGERPTVGKEW